MGTPASSLGLFASLRQALATGIELVHTRLELLTTDLEREKLRLLRGLLLAGIGLILLTVGLVLLCGFIVLLFAEGHRLAALGVLTLLFGGGAVLLLRAAAGQLQSKGGLLQATLAELDADRQRLTPTEPS